MNNKSNISGVIATQVIYFALIIVISLCSWLIPFPHKNETVFLWTYFATLVMLTIEIFITSLAYFGESKTSQQVATTPLLVIGHVVVIIQIIVAIAFNVLNAFINLPVYTIIIAESLIFVALIFEIAKGCLFKDRTIEFQNDTKKSTTFMDTYRARLKSLVTINNIKSIKAELSDLYDIALSSDPVSNSQTFEAENELLSLLQDLDTAIKNGSEDSAIAAINSIKIVLVERSNLCKSSK